MSSESSSSNSSYTLSPNSNKNNILPYNTVNKLAGDHQSLRAVSNLIKNENEALRYNTNECDCKQQESHLGYGPGSFYYPYNPKNSASAYYSHQQYFDALNNNDSNKDDFKKQVEFNSQPVVVNKAKLFTENGVQYKNYEPNCANFVQSGFNFNSIQNESLIQAPQEYYGSSEITSLNPATDFSGSQTTYIAVTGNQHQLPVETSKNMMIEGGYYSVPVLSSGSSYPYYYNSSYFYPNNSSYSDLQNNNANFVYTSTPTASVVHYSKLS